tara:strand:- start:298560 stop:298847 length:288 start_codon:yes stop_codon:yes gene_type:complete
MRKLYFVTAINSSKAAESALANRVGRYPSHFVIGRNTWVIAAGKAASDLYEDLNTEAEKGDILMVSVLNGNLEFTKDGSKFARWMAIQLAATTAY